MHGRREQTELAVERFLAPGRRDRLQVLECRNEAASDLRRSSAGEADLVEREVHVRVPVHGAHDQAYLAGLVAMLVARERAGRDLTQAVVQPVDRLHRGGGIEER